MWMWQARTKLRDNCQVILQVGQAALFFIWFGVGLAIANYVEQEWDLQNPESSPPPPPPSVTEGKGGLSRTERFLRGLLKLFVVYPSAVTATEQWPRGLKHVCRFLQFLWNKLE